MAGAKIQQVTAPVIANCLLSVSGTLLWRGVGTRHLASSEKDMYSLWPADTHHITPMICLPCAKGLSGDWTGLLSDILSPSVGHRAHWDPQTGMCAVSWEQWYIKTLLSFVFALRLLFRVKKELTKTILKFLASVHFSKTPKSACSKYAIDRHQTWNVFASGTWLKIMKTIS